MLDLDVIFSIFPFALMSMLPDGDVKFHFMSDAGSAKRIEKFSLRRTGYPDSYPVCSVITISIARGVSNQPVGIRLRNASG